MYQLPACQNYVHIPRSDVNDITLESFMVYLVHDSKNELCFFRRLRLQGCALSSFDPKQWWRCTVTLAHCTIMPLSFNMLLMYRACHGRMCSFQGSNKLYIFQTGAHHHMFRLTWLDHWAHWVGLPVAIIAMHVIVLSRYICFNGYFYIRWE